MILYLLNLPVAWGITTTIAMIAAIPTMTTQATAMPASFHVLGILRDKTNVGEEYLGYCTSPLEYFLITTDAEPTNLCQQFGRST